MLMLICYQESNGPQTKLLLSVWHLPCSIPNVKAVYGAVLKGPICSMETYSFNLCTLDFETLYQCVWNDDQTLVTGTLVWPSPMHSHPERGAQYINKASNLLCFLWKSLPRVPSQWCHMGLYRVLGTGSTGLGWQDTQKNVSRSVNVVCYLSL